MIKLDSLTADTYKINQVTLQWEFEPTAEDLNNYELDVYRSESPGISGIQQYDKVASGITLNTDTYDDTSVSGLYDPNRTWYYKLDVINTVSGISQVQPDNPAYIKAVMPDYRARYILRYKNIAINRYSGRTFYLLKRRTWGTHCEETWDETLQRVNGEPCPDCNCYGTGWEDGYFEPMDFPGMINPEPKVDEITMFGEFKPSDSLLYMLNYPPIRPSDIIVDHDKRYYVVQIQATQRLGITIEQRGQLRLIHPDDVTYTIPIPGE